MKKHFHFLTLLLLILAGNFSIFSQPSSFLKNYYESNKQQIKEDFFLNFPYEKYLQSISFNDFQILQKDRYFLYEKFKDGDPFIFHLGEFFVKTYKLQTFQDVKERIEIGEKFIGDKRFGEKVNNQKVNEIYKVVGYFLLGTSARFIGEEIKSGKFTDKSPELLPLIERLKKSKVYIEQQDSPINKLINSDITQIWQRFWDILHLKRGIIFVSSLIGFILSLCIIVFSTSGWKYFGGVIFLPSFILIGCLGFDYFGTTPLKNPEQDNNVWKSNYSLSSEEKLYTLDSNGNSVVSIFQLIDSKNTSLGEAIFMRRSKIKATYFANQENREILMQRYKDFRGKVKPVLVTVGGYSNVFQQPEGLTFDTGGMVNAVLLHDREGLALFSCGGINVINLDDKEPRLPIDCDSTKSVPSDGNPRDSLIAYSKLLDWARENNATLFQTHLLSHGNELRIDEKKASPSSKERRILALVRENNGDGEPLHIIFNIKRPHQLALIAKEIFAILKMRNYKIEAMLNLDTGKYDILEVYNENGDTFKKIKGTKNLDTATNLLFYYVE